MLLWPVMTHTSPTTTLAISTFSLPVVTTMACGSALASRAGKLTSQRPLSPAALASALSLPSWTETDLPGSAQPQTTIGLSRWRTMLLAKMPCTLRGPASVTTGQAARMKMAKGRLRERIMMG